jgi:hypothetical protein
MMDRSRTADMQYKDDVSWTISSNDVQLDTVGQKA